MFNFVFLLKNGKVKIKPNFDKFFLKNYDEIKYLLLPINDHSFIIHKPKDYMKKFHHCKIIYEMCIIHDDIISYVSTPIEKEMNNVVDLIQYLHSLNRLIYCNKLANSSEAQCYERTEFSYFKIEIYDNLKNEIFTKEMNLTNQKGKFGPIEIIDNISEIYHPVRKISDRYIYINDTWGFENYPSGKNSNLYGLLLPYTKSITFYNYNTLQYLLNTIRAMYFCVSTYNPEIVADDECEIKSMIYPDSLLSGKEFCRGIRIYDYWTSDINAYIEFIEYSYYIRNNTRIISELNDYNEIKNTYHCTITYELELLHISGNWKTNSIRRYVSDDNDLSIYDILRNI